MGMDLLGQSLWCVLSSKRKRKHDHVWLETKQGFQNWILVSERAVFPDVGPGHVKLGPLRAL